MTSPIILITPFLHDCEPGKDISSLSVKTGYADAVRSSGGIPVVAAYQTFDDSLQDLAEVADGLLLQGGVDVDPASYGEEKNEEKCEETSKDRDEVEKTLIRAFLEKKKPILGICRGNQMINVVFGGTLYQDIKTEIPSGLCHMDPKLSRAEQYSNPAHDVTPVKNTALASYFPLKSIPVNSVHHQSIKRVAPGLAVNALSEDGIIEGVESENMEDQWMLGVQWHPEAMGEKFPEQKIIFEKFIEAVKKRKLA